MTGYSTPEGVTHAPLVLLGGSGLGPWAWQRVLPHLEHAGVIVIVPTLAATGDDQTPPAHVDLDVWIDDVVRALDDANIGTATLVAHSFAGYLAAALAERHSDRVNAIVFVDANIPEPGVPWLTAMGPEVESMLLASVRDDAVPFFTPERFDAVHPDTGLGTDDRALLLASARPQPVTTQSQVAISSQLDHESARMAYVRCTRTTPPAADVEGWSRVVDLNTGHWPMLSAPELLADSILAAIRAIASDPELVR